VDDAIGETFDKVASMLDLPIRVAHTLKSLQEKGIQPIFLLNLVSLKKGLLISRLVGLKQMFYIKLRGIMD